MIFFESHEAREKRIEELSNRLHERTCAHVPRRNKHGERSDEYDAIDHYTSGSSTFNHKLISGGKLSDNEENMHNTIMHNARPIGEHVRLYSGTHHDFGKLAKESKDGILHSPAHISASHSLNIATRFAKKGSDVFKGDHTNQHMLVIHAKPSDKGFHVSRTPVSIAREHETIIPAGTKLKYIRSQKKTLKIRHSRIGETHQYFKPVETTVHHFKIHSQED